MSLQELVETTYMFCAPYFKIAESSSLLKSGDDLAVFFGLKLSPDVSIWLMTVDVRLQQ